MKTSSAKNKGRKLQQWVRDSLIEQLGLSVEDVKSTSMGCGGEDVTLSSAARKAFPYSIECKNTERLNLWGAYEQAKENCLGNEPIVVIKRNRSEPLVVVNAEYFIKLHRKDG